MPTTSGLSHEEAKRLLSEHGFNEIAVFGRRTAVAIFFSQFTSILVMLLLVASVISFLLSDVLDGVFILLIVMLNSILGFVQEYRAERALLALRKLAVSKTTVIRDGKEMEIDSRFLVPADVIKVEEGDKIPADAKLLSGLHLEVNEASLTGESLPVFKKEDEEEHNRVWLGTIVVSGRGMAVVEATGMRTRFGNIAKRLSEITPSATPLQKQLAVLGKQLGAIALFASALVFLFGILRGQEVILLFLTSISLAVAAVPEGLPAVITITLAIGVHRMAKEKAIVRKMAAIETLGAATLIATDKTGTITRNEMRVRELFVDSKKLELRGQPSEASPAKGGRLEVSKGSIGELLKIGVLVNTASLVFRHDGESFDLIGDPTEGALLLLAHDLGLSPDAVREQGKLLDEFSFDVERKTMSVIWQEDGKKSVYVKGAPEQILERSVSVVHDGKEEALSDVMRIRIEEAIKETASGGFRLIAMAKKPWTGAHTVTREEVESDLTFVGFTALSDPPRPEVKEAAKKAASAGIETVVITGDNELTANAVATEVGLIREGEDILTGSQLDELTDEELLRILPNVRIFARTTPEHKLRIVRAYQTLGHVVAVTGDGVNDSLALKQANVGVAMGIAGTDVAKEASDLIVTDDNYATIVRAVEEGRTIFDNIVKSVVYLASGNLGELLTIFMAVLFGLPAPLLPVQILWINLVTDGLPALALASDTKDPAIMRRRPRKITQSVIGGENLRFILIVGSTIAAVVLALFALSLTSLSESQGRTIAFTTLILLHICVAFFVRGHYRIFTNRFLILSILLVIVIQGLILLIPALHPIFKVSPLW